METNKEHFVDSLQEQGLSMVRIRDKTEACGNCLEFVTKEGTIFLVGAEWFDFNGGIGEEYTKPFIEIAELKNKRNKLNREISTLKKATLQ